MQRQLTIATTSLATESEAAMSKYNENSVLFAIGSVIELAQQQERELHAEQERQAAEQDRAEAARVAQARRAAEETERTRLTQVAEANRHEWETQLAHKEAAIRARIDADTERELEMLRAEYHDGSPLVVPGRSRLSFAVASLVAFAVFGLGALGVHAMGNNNQSGDAHHTTASADTLSATEPITQPVVRTPTPRTTARPVESPSPKIHKPAPRPIAKPRPLVHRPRCRWVTTTQRIQNPLWNHPLNFEGRYKIIKKRVKKCRK